MKCALCIRHGSVQNEDLKTPSNNKLSNFFTGCTTEVVSKSYEVSDSKDIDAPTANLTAYDLLEDVCRQPESAEGCQCQTT